MARNIRTWLAEGKPLGAIETRSGPWRDTETGALRRVACRGWVRFEYSVPCQDLSQVRNGLLSRASVGMLAVHPADFRCGLLLQSTEGESVSERVAKGKKREADSRRSPDPDFCVWTALVSTEILPRHLQVHAKLVMNAGAKRGEW